MARMLDGIVADWVRTRAKASARSTRSGRSVIVIPL
jgi:hypothetical protein